MMKFFGLFFYVCAFIVSSASAQNPYVVRNIAVDAKGDNAIMAREEAFAFARKKGFEIVMGRLGATHVSFPSDQLIATMVNSFDINREKTSRNRYLASVNVVFNENAIRSYLGHAQSFGNSVLEKQAIMADEMLPNTITQNQKYKVEIQIRDLRHWLSLRNSLERMPMVSGVSLLSMRSDSAIAEVLYNGDAESFRGDLMPRGMSLFSKPYGQNSRAQYQLVSR